MTGLKVLAFELGENVGAIAVAALVLYVATAKPPPRFEPCFCESKVDIASLTVQKLANEAFPQWARSHPDQVCPDRLENLSEYMDTKDVKDPWGHPYELACPTKTGITVRSF